MDPSFGPEGGRLQDVVFCTAASVEAMSGSQCQGGNVRESISGRQFQGVNVREAMSRRQCQGGLY